MKKIIFFIFAALCLGATNTLSADNTPKRIAVVVGVSHYENGCPEKKPVQLASRTRGNCLGKLTTPENDVTAISRKLENKYGYEVITLVSKEETDRSNIIYTWQDALFKMDKAGGIALFYFAGHGIEIKGRNYLLPSDTRLTPAEKGKLEKGVRAGTPTEQQKVNALTQSSIDLQKLMEDLAKRQAGTKNLTGIFIVDACRENSFSFDDKLQNTQPIGVAPSAPPPGEMFIMYSAGMGQKALDGGKWGSDKSVFADSLLHHMDKDEVPLSQLATLVRQEVYRTALIEHEYIQTPAFYSQLHSGRTLTGDKVAEAELASYELFQSNKISSKIRQKIAKFPHRQAFIECPGCPEMVVLETFAIKTIKGYDKKFAIGKYETTNEEWNQCASEEIGGVKCPNRGTRDPRLKRHPITGITWHDTQIYGKWLSKKTGASYRLPTEAEWEFAAHGLPNEHTTPTAYSFGNKPATKANPHLICQYANGADEELGLLPNAYRHCTDGVGRKTATVGSYKPNPYYLRDVHGNVWEWTQNCWPTMPSSSTGDVAKDAKQTKDSVCSFRVARSGSWRSGLEALKTGIRNKFPANHSRSTIGFRILRVISERTEQ